jgi:hypothetical protein
MAVEKEAREKEKKILEDIRAMALKECAREIRKKRDRRETEESGKRERGAEE